MRLIILAIRVFWNRLRGRQCNHLIEGIFVDTAHHLSYSKLREVIEFIQIERRRRSTDRYMKTEQLYGISEPDRDYLFHLLNPNANLACEIEPGPECRIVAVLEEAREYAPSVEDTDRTVAAVTKYWHARAWPWQPRRVVNMGGMTPIFPLTPAELKRLFHGKARKL